MNPVLSEVHPSNLSVNQLVCLLADRLINVTSGFFIGLSLKFILKFLPTTAPRVVIGGGFVCALNDAFGFGSRSFRCVSRRDANNGPK